MQRYGFDVEPRSRVTRKSGRDAEAESCQERGCAAIVRAIRSVDSATTVANVPTWKGGHGAKNEVPTRGHHAWALSRRWALTFGSWLRVHPHRAISGSDLR